MPGLCVLYKSVFDEVDEDIFLLPDLPQYRFGLSGIYSARAKLIRLETSMTLPNVA